jgi:uncharacterized protein YndB with AHSA1/START domain
MPEIAIEFEIDAPVERVWEAVSTTDALKSWWTDDSFSDAKLGGKAEFGFQNREIVFTMETTLFDVNEFQEWRCLNGPDNWIGTNVSFELESQDGKTQVRFEHRNLREGDAENSKTKETWDKCLDHLKGFVEGKNPGPFFKGS